MTKRTFTPEQDRQIAADYRAGATYAQLATKYGGDAGATRRAVKRGGGVSRTSGETQRKFTPEQDRQLAEEYAAGTSYEELAERHGTTRLAVRGAVRRAGGRTRNPKTVGALTGLQRRNFTPEQDKQLAAEYDAGSSYRRLAKKYGGTDISIRNAVLRGGGTPRPSVKPNEWSDACKPEALALYRKGVSVRDLAKKYGTRTETISQLLAEVGQRLHSGGRAHPRFKTFAQCVDVIDAYEAGASLASLAERFNCSPPTIKSAILRGGGTIRETGKPRSVPGGRCINGGYVMVIPSQSDKPYCVPNDRGYVMEHRLVMGRALGRPLAATESVHHKDGDRTNNDLSNLQLRQGAHGSGVVFTCNACGSHDVRAMPIAG